MYEEMSDFRGLLDALFYAGESFVFFGVLVQEAQDRLERVVQIGEKIGNYNKIAQARLHLGELVEGRGRLEEAINYGRKALEYFALTDSLTAIYGRLAISSCKGIR